MLAVRFGEWMYSTGKDFVFGELITNDSSTATLEYPGGSLMSYNLYQNMASFSFNHFYQTTINLEKKILLLVNLDVILLIIM